MNEYDDMFDAIKKGLELQQLTARNQAWASSSEKDKYKIIDEQITDILNPKVEPKYPKLTEYALGKDVSSGGSE